MLLKKPFDNHQILKILEIIIHNNINDKKLLHIENLIKKNLEFNILILSIENRLLTIVEEESENLSEENELFDYFDDNDKDLDNELLLKTIRKDTEIFNPKKNIEEEEKEPDILKQNYLFKQSLENLRQTPVLKI